MPGALWMGMVRSTVAHARIVGIDASAALAMPGVHAVHTGADLEAMGLWGGPMPCAWPVTADMVKPGAAVIDVGINRIADPAAKGGSRLVGDVDFAPVAEVAGAISPVPGGVGPLTVAMLLANTLLAAELRIGQGPR